VYTFPEHLQWYTFREKHFTDMKVTIVHLDLGIGGAEQLIVNMATAVQELDHEVTLLTSHHDPNHCFEETKPNGAETQTPYKVKFLLLLSNYICYLCVRCPRKVCTCLWRLDTTTIFRKIYSVFCHSPHVIFGYSSDSIIQSRYRCSYIGRSVNANPAPAYF
jgi:hypothetical protein